MFERKNFLALLVMRENFIALLLMHESFLALEVWRKKILSLGIWRKKFLRWYFISCVFRTRSAFKTVDDVLGPAV